MNMDKYLQGIDERIAREQENKELSLALDKISMELRRQFDKYNSAKLALFINSDEELKNKIRKVCKEKNIQITENNNIMKLSYMDYTSFTVNIGKDSRYISRSEKNYKSLGFKINHVEIENLPSLPESTIKLYGKEKTVNDISICEELIGVLQKRLELLNVNQFKIQVEFDDKSIRDITSLDQIIDLMFS
jgi:hypothetical protein